MTSNLSPAYGVTQRRILADSLDAHVEELEVIGYTIVPSGLCADALDEIRERLDQLHRQQSGPTGEADLGADSDVVRCPLALDARLLSAATLPPVLDIARRFLGESIVLLQQNAILNRSQAAHYQSRWHRDLPYQHFVSTRPLALNALLCVDDFTLETGGTLVLPGSHMFEDFPSDQFIVRHERVANASAGSVIMMHAMLYHRAGANLSGRTRRGVNHLIGRPLLAQQIDIPRLLKGAYADDPFLSAYLGYRWNPAADVEAWRRTRA